MQNPTPTSSYQPLYFVRSGVTPTQFYAVSTDTRGLYQCECPDHTHRARDCKHIRQVQAGAVREAVRTTPVPLPVVGEVDPPAPFPQGKGVSPMGETVKRVLPNVDDLYGDADAIDRAVARVRGVA